MASHEFLGVIVEQLRATIGLTGPRQCRSFELVMPDPDSGHSNSVVRCRATVCDGYEITDVGCADKTMASLVGQGRDIQILFSVTRSVDLAKMPTVLWATSDVDFFILPSPLNARSVLTMLE